LIERLRYALVTPARDEAPNLPRLAESLIAQTVTPDTWMIVDNGSTDGTAEVARVLAASHSWVRVLEIPGEAAPQRGAAAVRAFTAGITALEALPEIVVNVDADVTLEPDHFERLLAEFRSDPALGIASGTCWELEDGSWRSQHVTRGHARGAVRAYRRDCLLDVLPLVESTAWDGIDELKAKTRGWKATNLALPIRHHRPLGRREAGLALWTDAGEAAHFMGYRPSYLAVRAAYRALRDPVALAMIYGYARSAVRRTPRYEDPAVRKLLRDEQALRRLPRRIREALGRT
jgi:glycosyltransferase involved in cell wall biosynthesis